MNSEQVTSLTAALLAGGADAQTIAKTIAAVVGGQTAPATKSTKTTKRAAKETKPREPVAETDRCIARVWQDKDTKEFGARCACAKKAETDFCPQHYKQAQETEDALQFTAEGAKRGLHLGRYDREIEWRAASGEVCYAQFAPAGAVEALRHAGEFKWHPFVKEGRQESGAVVPKKQRKPKADKPVKVKKARGQNAYMCFLNETFEGEEFPSRRAQVKAAMLLEEEFATAGKVPITAITKRISEQWKEIKGTEAAAKYDAMAAASKATVSAPPSTPIVTAKVVEATLANAAHEEEEEEQSAEEILAELGVSTPTPEQVAAGIEAAKANGLWEEPAEDGGESEEDEELEEAEPEEFEHNGVTYLKIEDGRLFQMEDEQPVLKGQVDADGNVTLEE